MFVRDSGKELLAPHPTPTLEDHPVSAVCDLIQCSRKCHHHFLHPQPEDAPSCGDNGDYPLSWPPGGDLGDSIVVMTTASPVNFGDIPDVVLSGGHFFL
jgi:hypothetical protein